MASEDARYRQTSQYRLWSFSPAQLASVREQTNSLARTNITNRLKASSPPVDPLPDFLTPDEELTLLTFYTVETLRAATHFKLSTDIRATAAIFLRRFYTTNSIMTYPPTELLKTCVFFACKAEGHFMRLQKFVDELPNTTGESVLAAEYVLCQAIRFAFDVKHPFRALDGAIMELRRYAIFAEDRLNHAHMNARGILKFSPLVTDAYCHFTPSQIMFGALAITDRELVEYMMNQVMSGQSDDEKEKVWTVISQCVETLQKEPPERFENYYRSPECSKAMKPLIRKLKKCRDPDRVDLVALQRARKEQGMQKPKPKPAAKADGDVFGSALSEKDREAKRRRVVENGKGVSQSNDPFGGAL
ncbi:cyclin-like protein [Microdochium trichocladiopsis]|uniref:Cyclin-like protein n=1 Tax=Microdochium trichocladiopsis TaxID=1682393 RepID=A0A9P8Y7T0_9PEZI|nr:cyclin-like protein [Microdochium trichocladiopsis]KAH7032702.1 cyclin-like protein [Microdochium trichocladiopsis]